MIYSYEPLGYEVKLVHIETSVRKLDSKNSSRIQIVGMCDSLIRETENRITSAIENSGYELPAKEMLLSISPVDMLKKSCNHDLALALSALCSPQKDILVLGELDAEGNTRPARGAYAAMQEAIEMGIKYAIVAYHSDVPPEGDISVHYAKNLTEAAEAMEFFNCLNDSESTVSFPDGEDYKKDSDILLPNCSEKTVRAVIVAAAGKHNILLWGNKECGKELALEALKDITPLPTSSEAQTINRIHSIAGLLSTNKNFTPYRIPHQSVTVEGLIGGGVNLNPGEISLAHGGILCLQDVEEFSTSCLQFLKISMSSKCITLFRAGQSTTFPADFQLAVTATGCPCGNFGRKDKVCQCSSNAVKTFWKKISFLNTDQIPIRFEVVEPENKKDKSRITVAEARRVVEVAINIQRERGFYNGQAIFDFDFHSDMSEDAVKFTNSAVFDNFTPTEANYVLYVARTLADIEQMEHIEARHIKEALALHQPTPLDTLEDKKRRTEK